MIRSHLNPKVIRGQLISFSGGREISKAGTRDLPLGFESITMFTIVKAGSLDDAETMARCNPYISSIRVYEVMSKETRPQCGRRRGIIPCMAE
jgi:hypothetical protein